MGTSADVLMYDWDVIVDAIVHRVGDTNRRTVENVLNLFGEKICDKYVILSSDHYDFSEDSLSPMCEAIDKIFNTDDMNDDIYSDMLNVDHEFIGGRSSKKCAGCNDLAINIMMCEQCNGDAGGIE